MIADKIETDINFVKYILPNHYNLLHGFTKQDGEFIRCRSNIGIRKDFDAEDDEHWGYIVKGIKNHFKERYQEIYHNTNFCHVDFVIYYTDRD